MGVLAAVQYKFDSVRYGRSHRNMAEPVSVANLSVSSDYSRARDVGEEPLDAAARHPGWRVREEEWEQEAPVPPRALRTLHAACCAVITALQARAACAQCYREECALLRAEARASRLALDAARAASLGESARALECTLVKLYSDILAALELASVRIEVYGRLEGWKKYVNWINRRGTRRKLGAARAQLQDLSDKLWSMIQLLPAKEARSSSRGFSPGSTSTTLSAYMDAPSASPAVLWTQHPPPRAHQQQHEHARQRPASDHFRARRDSGAGKEGAPPVRASSPKTPAASALTAVPSGAGSGFAGACWEVDYKDLELKRLLGEGSCGKVWHATWHCTEVAVKQLLSNLDTKSNTADNDLMRQSFHHEANIMMTLRHPNVVMFMGVSLQPLALVTEFCAKGSVWDVLRKAGSGAGPTLDWGKRLQMALGAARGMNYLHNHHPCIIHRDLKSANLCVDKNWTAKVCDFNLSKIMVATVVSGSMTVVSPRWMAPEVLQGKPFSKSADVFSFGVILWELLTLQVPWADKTSWQIMHAVCELRESLPIPETPELEFPAFAEFAELVTECWAPADERPSFVKIIARLQIMLDKTTTSMSAVRKICSKNGIGTPRTPPAPAQQAKRIESPFQATGVARNLDTQLATAGSMEVQDSTMTTFASTAE